MEFSELICRYLQINSKLQKQQQPSIFAACGKLGYCLSISHSENKYRQDIKEPGNSACGEVKMRWWHRLRSWMHSWKEALVGELLYSSTTPDAHQR